MNVLSLFDGISCGQVALERAGIKVENYYASEIDENAIKVTMFNYPDTMQLGSVIDCNKWSLPKIDLLIGGSPCQSFSVSNVNRDGFNNDNGKLFYNYIDMLNKHKPTYFLYENVAKMRKADENFITDHPGSVYRELAFFGRVAASFNRAISSIPAVQKERLLISKEYYNKYAKYYKAGDKKEDADALIAAIDKELEKYQKPTEN